MSLLHVLFNNEFELILNPADTSYPPVSYLGFLNYKISYTLLYLAVFGLKNGGQGASCKDDFALYFVFWMSQFFIYATKFIIVCRTVWGWIWDVSNSVQQKGFKQKVITQANQGEHSSLLRTFGLSATSTNDSYLPLLFGKFALIWGHFQNVSVCRFRGRWGRWGQTTSKSKTTKILNENLLKLDKIQNLASVTSKMTSWPQRPRKWLSGFFQKICF